MKRRLRSPSLFWTFAGAFLGVALLGTFLQGVVVVHLLRTIAKHTSGLDSVVRAVAEEVAAELARSPGADVSRILTAHQKNQDGAVLAYRDSTGREVFGSGAPHPFGPGGKPEPFEPGGGRRPPPGHGPPADLPPPPDHPDHEFRPGRGRGGPPPGLAVSQDVVVGGRTVGEVVAWQMGPPHGPRPIRPATRFLLSLPLALLVASVAGLIMFRNLLGRLRALEVLAGRVAQGDLAVRVPEPGADEIGRLGDALNRMTENLAAAKRAVDRTDQERRQLFVDISHELATPLTAIRGYAETLMNPSIPLSIEERERYLQHIHNASQRMDLLIQDLLELTRLEVGAVALATERIDWAALCRNTVERIEARFQEAGLRLQWSESPREAWIQADGRRMEQVIDNLLVNALRYVPRGGSVWVSIQALGSGPAATYRLVVADDGPGFPAADLPHVFDRFYRGDNAASTTGSGLGLAIVQEIVRRHGGQVRAVNREPGGASIEVELPAAGEVGAEGRS